VITRGEEHCTSANVDRNTERLGMDNAGVRTKMKSEKGHERSVRPKRNKKDRIQ
jgi:hypothetical protein